MEEIEEYTKFAQEYIQGCFWLGDMEVMKKELEKLEAGDTYLEVGVDEGMSMGFAHHFTKEGVNIIGIDIHDVVPHAVSVGRAPWMQEIANIVGLKRRGFYVHGDAQLFNKFFKEPFINVLFIDGHHNYDNVKADTLAWEPLVKPGGVILFHDYDHAETKQWLDEYYGDNKEVFYNKIVRVQK